MVETVAGIECMNASACRRRLERAGLINEEVQTEVPVIDPRWSTGTAERTGRWASPVQRQRGSPSRDRRLMESRAWRRRVEKARTKKERTIAAAAEADMQFRVAVRECLAAGFTTDTVAWWGRLSASRVNQISLGVR
jgi:hypothetical protein